MPDIKKIGDEFFERIDNKDDYIALKLKRKEEIQTTREMLQDNLLKLEAEEADIDSKLLMIQES